jgi:hypothetical protein
MSRNPYIPQESGYLPDPGEHGQGQGLPQLPPAGEEASPPTEATHGPGTVRYGASASLWQAGDEPGTAQIDGTRSQVQTYAQEGDAYWELRATTDENTDVAVWAEATQSEDGTSTYAAISVQTSGSNSGSAMIQANQISAQIYVQAAEGQTDPLLALKNSDGDSFIELQPYGDGTGSDLFMSAPGTSADVDISVDAANGAYVQADSTNGGYASIQTSDGGPKLTVIADPDQTASLLNLQDSTGNPVFSVDTQGPIISSPNSTQYRLKVANDGTLSTEAV